MPQFAWPYNEDGSPGGTGEGVVIPVGGLRRRADRLVATFMTRRVRADREELPFPGSLCHRCAAPPRYVRTASSIFIQCPLLADKYPRQPVLACPLFRPAEEAQHNDRNTDVENPVEED